MIHENGHKCIQFKIVLRLLLILLREWKNGFESRGRKNTRNYIQVSSVRKQKIYFLQLKCLKYGSILFVLTTGVIYLGVHGLFF